MMPTVVQFGAGAIGRGFLGQLWCEAGYETVFVDTNAALVQVLNERGSYPLHLVTNETTDARMIGPVRALYAADIPAILAELKKCAFAATAVGPGLEAVIEEIFVPFLRLSKKERRSDPLTVLFCENDATAYQAFRLTLSCECGLPNGRHGLLVCRQLWGAWSQFQHHKTSTTRF